MVTDTLGKANDLQLMRMPRVNVLLVGAEGIVENFLDSLLPTLPGPIASWRPVEPFELPPAGEAGTMILRDVGALTPDDQGRLQEWLEATAGRTQVVSTTASSLWSRVQAGTFIDTLYYRLNTVRADVSS